MSNNNINSVESVLDRLESRGYELEKSNKKQLVKMPFEKKVVKKPKFDFRVSYRPKKNILINVDFSETTLAKQTSDLERWKIVFLQNHIELLKNAIDSETGYALKSINPCSQNRSVLTDREHDFLTRSDNLDIRIVYGNNKFSLFNAISGTEDGKITAYGALFQQGASKHDDYSWLFSRLGGPTQKILNRKKYWTQINTPLLKIPIAELEYVYLKDKNSLKQLVVNNLNSKFLSE